MAATRRIFAFGGGHYGQHRDTYDREKPEGGYWPLDTKPVDDLIVAAAGVDAPNVLVVTTASEDGRRKADLLYEANQRRWGAYGAATQVLKLVEENPSVSEIEAAMGAADIVFVSGGNSVQMIERWRDLGVDRLLREAYERGVVMSGLSAGAICWFRYGNSDSFYTGEPFRVEAMGWFDAVMCPHYDSEVFRQEPLKKMVRRTPNMVGIALDEYAVIEILDDCAYRVHACRVGARAQRCWWDADTYHTQSVEPSPAWADLKALLTVPAGDSL